MKITSILIAILLVSTFLFGQTKLNTKPFIIQGQISDCTEKYLTIYFRDRNGQVLMDTLKLDESGKFYLKTFKVKEPQRTSIQQNNIQINDFFVAPGYQLTISGNGKDALSLFKSKKISGVGSESNRYRFMLDSIWFARKDTTKWFQLNSIDLLSYINKNQKLKDSIAHIVFDKTPIQDMFLRYFGEMVKLDIKFNKLYMLISHINWNNYDYENSVSFLRKNFDNTILDNLYKDEYLLSNDYRNGFIASSYLDYIVNLDYKKDSTLKNEKGYKLRKVNETYQGNVKEYVLLSQMQSLIRNSNSIKELNEYKDQFEPYILQLENNYYRNTLESKFSEKGAQLLKTQVGKPAPKFILQSSTGNFYSLNDFKDKVVYLDIWASWCSPCRAETPAFKILYDKFKNDNRIAFLSVAVNDGMNEWRKALNEDKPDWIQLLDQEGIFSKSYVVNAIPQFILIDKQGNIVDLDAPRPSSGEEIEKLLNSEIKK